MAINESLNAANDQTVKLVTSVQESILDATKTYLSTMSKAAPEMPTWAPQDNIADVPDTKELIEQTFTFQAQLLEANKSFALSLSELWTSAARPAGDEPKAASSKSTGTKADGGR